MFRDFPLDQVALPAAMVARALPPDRYEPFLSALFASQDRWAFAQGVNPTEEIGKMAALAGMSRQTFEQAIHDDALRDWILAEQDAGREEIQASTPLRASWSMAKKDRRRDELRRVPEADRRASA